MLERIIWIAIGAAIGANARYWLGEWIVQWGTERFGVVLPYGTFFVNVLGSLLLGLLVGVGLSWQGRMPASYRYLLAIGFLGSYTTFSSFSVESLLLIESGQWAFAIGNLLANNLFGLLCALLGLRLGQLLT